MSLHLKFDGANDSLLLLYCFCFCYFCFNDAAAIEERNLEREDQRREEATELLSIAFAAFNPERKRKERGERHKQEKDSFNFISAFFQTRYM